MTTNPVHYENFKQFKKESNCSFSSYTVKLRWLLSDCDYVLLVLSNLCSSKLYTFKIIRNNLYTRFVFECTLNNTESFVNDCYFCQF